VVFLTRYVYPITGELRKPFSSRGLAQRGRLRLP
jgi:hypothetical protein